MLQTIWLINVSKKSKERFSKLAEEKVGYCFDSVDNLNDHESQLNQEV